MDYYLRGIGCWAAEVTVISLNHILEDIDSDKVNNIFPKGGTVSEFCDVCQGKGIVTSQKRKLEMQDYGEGCQSIRPRLDNTSTDYHTDEEDQDSMPGGDEGRTLLVFDRWLEEDFETGPWFGRVSVVGLAEGSQDGDVLGRGMDSFSSIVYDHGIADLKIFCDSIGASEASSSL